jgi:Fe-S oxidoreductase
MSPLSNAQELKLRLLVEGVQILPEARAKLAEMWGDSAVSLADYATTNGISLRLESGMYVNAPVVDHNPNFAGTTQNTLAYHDGDFVASSGELSETASPLPLPAYKNEHNRWNEPFVWYVQSHADRVRISPISGCAYRCKFCDLSHTINYRRKSLERLLDGMDRALRDDKLPVTHALISGGTPRPEDYAHQHMVYEGILGAHPDFDIEIMLTPIPKLFDLPFLRSIGTSRLCVNLELYSEEAMRKYSPNKLDLGQAYFFDQLEKAAEAFGPGKVRSLVLIGLEDLSETLKGVEAIAQRGCDPVLSAFRPCPGTPLEKYPPPGIDLVREAYLRSCEIVSRYPGVEMGPRCLPCRHNSVAF